MNRIFLIISLLLGGCGTLPDFYAYDDRSLPRSEVSRIYTDSESDHTVLTGFNDVILISSIDGVSTEAPTWSTSKNKYPDAVWVLPGLHEVKLVWGNGYQIAYGCLVLETVAGRHYIIRQKVVEDKVYLWAEDLLSGKNLGGLNACS